MARRSRGWIQRWHGYDFFVSYSWQDGRTYALRLKELLEDRGFVVFIDSAGFARGDNWRLAGTAALGRSQRLVLVGSPRATTSEAVCFEVSAFREAGKRVLPIDIAGTLAQLDPAAPLAAHLDRDILRLDEVSPDALATGPSASVVEDIVGSYELIRENTRRTRRLYVAVAFFGLLAGVAVWLAALAVSARRTAEAARIEAEHRRAIAEGAQAGAILEQPERWVDGLAVATRAVLRLREGGQIVPPELHGALFSGVWGATPFRVVATDASTSAGAAVAAADGAVAHVLADGRVLLDRAGTTRRLPLEPRRSTAVLLSPSGSHLMRITMSGEVTVADLERGARLDLPLSEPAWSAAFAPQGDRVYVGDAAGSVRAWSLDGDDLGTVWSGSQPILALAVSPDGSGLVLSDDSPAVHLLDLDSWQAGGDAAERVCTAHSAMPDGPERYRSNAVAWSPSGKLFATGGAFEAVMLWESESCRLAGEPYAGHLGPVTSVAFSPDGAWLASGGEDGDVRLWHAGEPDRDRTLHGHAGPVRSVGFGPDSRWLVSAAEDGSVLRFQVEAGVGQLSVEGHLSAPCSAAVSADGSRLVTRRGEGAIVWDSRTGRELFRVPETGVQVVGASLAPDGSKVAITRLDGEVAAWDVVGQRPLWSRSGDAESVAFSPDGSTVVVAHGSGVTTLEAGSGTVQQQLARGLKINRAAFSGDGQRVITAGDDGAVRVYEVSSGALLLEKALHTVSALSACESPDGRLVASAGADRFARVLELDTGSVNWSMSHADWLRAAVFSPDGRTVLTTGEDATTRLWDLATGSGIGRVSHANTMGAVWLDAERLAISVDPDRTLIGPYAVQDLLVLSCALLSDAGEVMCLPGEAGQEIRAGCARLDAPRRSP